MKKLLRVLGLAVLLTLGACQGGGGGGGGTVGPTKPVNSYWTMISNNYGGPLINLDMRKVAINTPYAAVNNINEGASFRTLGGPYSGLIGIAVGTGCSLIDNNTDISCTYIYKLTGTYNISSENKMTIHTTEAQEWDGYVWTSVNISALEFYR